MNHRLQIERPMNARRTAAALGVGAAALFISPAAAHATQIATTATTGATKQSSPQQDDYFCPTPEVQKRRTLLLAALRTPVAEPSPGLPTPGSPDSGGGPDADPGAPTPGTPAPAPDPAPAPAPAPQSQPNFDGPGTIPDPPSVAPIIQWTPPSYTTPYTPALPMLRAPRRVKPQPQVKPPPNKIRIGNFITDIPEGMADSDVRSVNRWSAATEAQVATGLIALGVPEDEATRRAAATVIGVAIGGATGATVAGVPAAALGAALGIVPGAVAGGIAGGLSTVPLSMLLTPILGPAAPSVAGPLGIGLGILGGGAAGAAGGAALLGIPAALLGGAAGAALGGFLAYMLGAGDPGDEPGTVRNPGTPEDEKGYELPPPNPKANQYELKLGNPDSKLPGGPAAEYVVRANGDVRGHVQIGGLEMPFGWSADAADGPYRALGFLSESARESVKGLVYRTGIDQIAKIPGLQIGYPQSVKPGQDVPMDGRLGKAELDRQKEQEEARERAIQRSQDNPTPETEQGPDGAGTDKGAPNTQQSEQSQAPSGPKHSAPRRAAVATVPTATAPSPVDTVVKQVEKATKPINDAVDQAAKSINKTVNGWTPPPHKK